MHIDIAERLKPFSHLPGTYFLIPGSQLRVQIYPSHVSVHDLSSDSPVHLLTLNFDWKGPVEGFTVIQDLEAYKIHVFGQSFDGYFRYHFTSLNNGQVLSILFEKVPNSPCFLHSEGKWQLQNKREAILPKSQVIFGQGAIGVPQQPTDAALPSPIARLSLGNHKSQDWAAIKKRQDFVEVFPLWHRLGQFCHPHLEMSSKNFKNGMAALLHDCRETIKNNRPEQILPCFKKVFLCGFEGGLSPRWHDTDYHGILPPYQKHASPGVSPLYLLAYGAQLIQSLFIQENASELHLLPALPPEFHCGRLVDVTCGHNGRLSMEWTKKELRCFTFVAEETTTLRFHVAKGAKTCRVRQGHKDRGITYQVGDEIKIFAKMHYWFDNFLQ